MIIAIILVSIVAVVVGLTVLVTAVLDFASREIFRGDY